MAIAVAPVTHWKFYDNIYTERYNGLPQDNKEGYDAGSPLTYVDQMQGRLLLVHGTGDDNVHYQNTESLVNALVAANKQFEFMSYPNRNHGIFGGNTTLHLRELLTRFHRRDAGPSPDAAGSCGGCGADELGGRRGATGGQVSACRLARACSCRLSPLACRLLSPTSQPQPQISSTSRISPRLMAISVESSPSGWR